MAVEAPPHVLPSTNTSSSESSTSTLQRRRPDPTSTAKGSRKRPRTGTAFSCGLGAGVIQAGLLNPYDRALFLSVKERRPFLHIDNFRRPYQGFLQSVSGRAVRYFLKFWHL